MHRESIAAHPIPLSRGGVGWMALALVWVSLLGWGFSASPALGTEDFIKAPTRLHGEPAAGNLLPLPGDWATFRYSFGSLDRAANLQTRFEVALRLLERWTNRRVEVATYVLTRDEWEASGYSVEYGVPVRVGRNAIAVPALGDDGTVALWSRVLDGMLPQVQGLPIRGTPQHAATLVLADIVAQLLMAEIVIDEVGLAGDSLWLRGLMTHVASLDFARRKDAGRIRDLDNMYRVLHQQRRDLRYSSRDYDADLDLRDWLWFQGHFHAGANLILEREGKGALKRLRKLAKKDHGVLRGERVLRDFKGLEDWFAASFSAVSFRTS